MVRPILLWAIVAHICVLSSSTQHRRVSRTSLRFFPCSKNEIWAQCPDAVCAPKTCDDVGMPIPCYDLNPNSTCPSKPRCICKEGFVRNSDEECIPVKSCPSCGGDLNAEPGCGTKCNRLCSNYFKNEESCMEECFYNACECKCGFVFDEIIEKCVLPDDCTPFLKCGRNEVYDICPSHCPARTCGIDDAAISCAPALPIGHPDCPPPICRCEDGFYRNHLGHCVRWEHCPRCRRPNEMYDPCPALCPPRTCDANEALILCPVPPQLGDTQCKPGCRCIDGFVRNHHDICIPKEKCPRCTKPNQVFDPCIAPCPPRRCDVDERLIKCAAPPQRGDPNCVAGCRCADGHKTNSEGVCIPQEECPPRCQLNEEYSNCTQSNCGPQNCSQLGFPVRCSKIDPKFCKEGCLCKKGYLRNHEEICIPSSECPSCGGDSNKVEGCGIYCNQRCRDIGKEPGFCILLCKVNDCDCRKGFYLDDNTGLCVLPKHCTPQCSSNEVYSECIQGSCRPQKCSERGSPVPCPKIDPKFCTKGCLCKKGYLRNRKGVCVPSSECPPRCPLNEEYSNCTQSNCGPQNCSQLGFPVRCTKIDPKFCKEGCLCKKGYLRNHEGICIPSSECPSCGGDSNKVEGCGIYCNQRCRDIGKEPGFCILLCKVNDCDCRKGFYLDDNTGLCVLPKHCTPQCSSNEVYSECIQGSCRPQKCSERGSPVPCPKIDPKFCTKGCLCKKGYLRNRQGVCVPSSECPPRCPLNEEYSNCTQSHCGLQNCSQLGFPVRCTKIDPKFCKEGCLCKNGYLRNHLGICIPVSDCPSCGGDTNKVSGCGMYCNQRCRDIGKKPVVCALGCKQNSCDCRKGLYLDENTGFCVLPKDCTPQCQLYEMYSECIQGNCSPQKCSEVESPKPCPRIDPKFCKKGCLCMEGYVRNYRGVCIPISKCPPKCPVNEVYSDCTNGGCKARNCSQYGQPTPCIDPKYCYEGCVCKDTYLRASNGMCIPEKDCPEACYGAHEEYSECSWDCPPQTCESLDKRYACPIREEYNCRPMCRCQPGYLRNKIGQCITIQQCKKCMGKNEYYSCGGACDNVCKTLHLQSQKNCTLVNIKCNEMCYCEEGYARAKNNTCIPIDACKNDTTFCIKNEVFEDCSNPVCKPEFCKDLGFPLNCKSGCKQRCICRDGYVRSDQGRCIPIKKCPSCGGDENAVSGCGGNCGKKCSDLHNKGQIACSALCRENGCDCKPEYYYDEIIKKCVKPEHCTPQCPINERYEKCPSACEPQYCKDLGNSSCSPPPTDGSCVTKPGCICIDGYVRDQHGKCIPKNKCTFCGKDSNAQYGCGMNCGRRCKDLIKEGPCLKICKPNSCDCKKGFYYDSIQKRCGLPGECTDICGKYEFYEDCSKPVCRPENCSQVGLPCNNPCVKGCSCQRGYVRDKNGICIPIDQCPPQCPINERFEKCPSSCEPQYCKDLGDDSSCLPPPTDGSCPTKAACICIDGYVRDQHGKCIPKEDCSFCGKDSNAQYGCGVNCGRRCKDLIKQGICPRICKSNSCDCKKGFYYDSIQKRCCLPGQCTDICGKNEFYEDCSKPVCRPENCSQVGLPCNNPCVKGCACQRGYVRDKNGICIPIDQCPIICPVNEVNSDCINGGCFPKNCSQYGQPIPCIKMDPKYCIKGCVCKEKYLRASNGLCIPKEDCPEACKDPNEEYSECSWDCPPQTCDSLDKVYECPIMDEGNCRPMCRCKSGYYRNKLGQCVTKEECTENCGKYEVYEDCSKPICKAKNCNQLGFPLDCKKPCVKGCVCQNGYVRNKFGICIPINKCPSCGGDPHAQSGCGTNCGQRCPNNYINPKFCPRIACTPLLNKCDCRPGFFYDINTKNCVTFENCSPRCDAFNNEIPDACVNGGCGWRNCSQVGGPKLCIDPVKCIKGCKCKDRYYRLDNGTCVPEHMCPIPSCGGDINAQPGCGYNCGKRCPNNYVNPKFCPRIKCEPTKCDCKDGFYFDINTKYCVKLENCSPRCNERNNEVYDPCPPICPPQTCDSLTHKYFCPRQNATDCKGQCRCKPGFYKNILGECICKEDCLKCGLHEYFSCGPECDNVCGNLHKESRNNCPRLNTQCVKKCYCEEGYARNATGTCIPIKDCPVICNGPNEYYTCGPECDNVCGKLETESKDNCPIKNKKCTSKCYCKDGFARNARGKCIPINECPGTPTTTTCKPTAAPVNVTDAIAKFERGNHAMAVKLIYYLVQSRPGENFMISGFSILLVLAQLVLYALGTTFEQIMKLLNLNTKNEVRAIFPILIKNYRAQQEVTFNIANKCYSDIKYPFSKGFKEDTLDVFDSKAQSLNFSRGDEAAYSINDWVKNNTNGVIKNLVDSKMFNEDTRCVLVNALYFLGNWKKQFPKENTRPRDFFIDKNNTVSKDTMCMEGQFEYAENDDLGCQIIKVPYENGNFSLWIYLPLETFELGIMVKKLLEPDSFANSMKSMALKNVKFYLPVIDDETNISDLPDLLVKIGVTELFKQNSDFEGIMERDVPLFVSDAIQKTVLKVNEKGTEAAAATAVMVSTLAVTYHPESYTVNCNHPFFYSLQIENFPMFYGVYSGQ